MATRISREAACCIPTAQASADGRCTFVKPSRPASTPRTSRASRRGDHEAVVRGVLAGQADAGFVRSDLLESMAAAGSSLSAVRVVAPRGTPGYPICTAPGSTRMAVCQRRRRARRARPAGCGGAAVDARGRAGRAERGTAQLDFARNCQSIHELFRTAYLGPYSRERIGWRQVVTQYDLQISIFIAAVIAMLAAALLLIRRSNRALRTERDRHTRHRRATLGREARFRSLFEENVLGIIYQEPNGRIVACKQGRRADSRDSRARAARAGRVLPRVACVCTLMAARWHPKSTLDAGAGRAPGALRCAHGHPPPLAEQHPLAQCERSAGFARARRRHFRSSWCSRTSPSRSISDPPQAARHRLCRRPRASSSWTANAASSEVNNAATDHRLQSRGADRPTRQPHPPRPTRVAVSRDSREPAQHRPLAG